MHIEHSASQMHDRAFASSRPTSNKHILAYKDSGKRLKLAGSLSAISRFQSVSEPKIKLIVSAVRANKPGIRLLEVKLFNLSEKRKSRLFLPRLKESACPSCF